MKRLILLAGGLLAMFQVSAQELPKSLFVSAGIGGSIQQNDQGGSTKSFQVSPSVNYLLNERWSLGLFVEHNRQTTETKMTSLPGSGGYYGGSRTYEIKNRSWTAGPQVRYYQPIVSKIFVFGETQAGFRAESVEIKESSTIYYYGGLNGPVIGSEKLNAESEATSVQVNVSPGLVYFIKPRFGIELKANMLNYNHGLKNSMTPDEDTESKNFNAEFSLSKAKFGASFYF
jgi:hypothetical protein